MKCENCRYRNKESFDNTRLHPCNVAIYIIEKLKKEKKNIWLTDALTVEEDDCMFQHIFKEHKK